jgi:hypothetical protein
MVVRNALNELLTYVAIPYRCGLTGYALVILADGSDVRVDDPDPS